LQALKQLRWKMLKQRTTFMKLIIYFVSANVLVLVLSLVALFSLSSRTLLDEIGDHSESLLINGAQNTAQLMEWSINYAYSSSTDVQLEAYALSEDHSDFDTYTVWNRIMSVKNGNPSIDSVYLINDYSQSVIDSRIGLNELDGFYDQEVIQRLRARKITDGVFLIPRTLHLPLDQNKDKKVITAIIPYETGKSISAFVLNMDADRIMALLQNNSSFQDTEVFVLNDKNEMVFSTTDLNAEQIGQFNNAMKDGMNGWKLYKPKGWEEQMLVYAKTSINGIQEWRFFETIPKSGMLSKINLLRNLTLLIFCCLFFASIWVIVFLSKRVYSPIQELVANVMKQQQLEKGDNQRESNELVYLSNVFVSQFEKINELTEYERQNKFLARERFMRELLMGMTPTVTEIRDAYDKLGIAIPEEHLSIAIYRIDHFVAFSKNYSEKDQSLLRYAMANIIEEALQDEFSTRLQTVDMGADHIAVILPVGRGQSAAAYAIHLQESQRLITQYLSLSTTVACGKYIESFTELHESYMAAYEMTQERFRFGHGCLVTEEHSDNSSNELYQMPQELERQLKQAVQKGALAEMLQVMDTVLVSLRDRPYFECKLSLITFFMDIRRSLQEASSHVVLSSSWGLTSIENQIINMETLAAVGEWMKELSSQTLEEIAAARSVSKNAGLVEAVDALIEKYLTDANLTTRVLSGELGLSVNYLRNLYKLETSRSITETITDKRLNMICKELLSSDEPIEPIILKYGFTALNTFYVAFKKKYNVTPALYRKMNKNLN